ncbi:carboxymuconolactone decarboxylase family protein [Nitrospinota bacterium]
MQRELVVMAIMASKGMKEELYLHAKKALRLGATMEQLLEGFEVCFAPGGLALLREGL